MSKTFSKSDVSSHNKPDSLYIIVDEDVYDLTQFQDDHPGKHYSRKSQPKHARASHDESEESVFC